MDKTFYIGHNINISHGLVSSSDYAKSIGANFYQIFLHNPQKYGATKHSKKDILALKTKLKDNGQKLVIHGSFMTNFCNEVDDYRHKKAIDLVISDLNYSRILGAIGVVIHMGKRLKMDRDYALSNYVKGIKTVLANTENSTIIFETGAGVGTEICTDIFCLKELYDKFTDKEKERIKFCIDTCHIHASGYDIGHPQFCKVYCNLVEIVLGWDNVVCVHLNDSKCSLNSRKDRHADLGEGTISLEGLKRFVKFCYKKDIPIVLETPCDYISRDEQIAMVKSWVNI